MSARDRNAEKIFYTGNKEKAERKKKEGLGDEGEWPLHLQADRLEDRQVQNIFF